MLTSYPHIVAKIKSTPWFIMPDALAVILDIVDRRLDGVSFTKEEVRIRLETAPGISHVASRAEAGGGIGLIPLYGPIFPKADLMTEMSGATSLESFRNDFRMLMNNDMVHTIVLDIDSPGGSSEMVSEMATEIRAARDIKPIYAVSNTIAGSGAYYLGSQASKMFVTPSGMVGSIGAYTVHEDESRKVANEGRDITLISAGRFKIEGNPYEPLSQEGKDYRQEVIDELYGEFVEAVALGRNVSTDKVTADYGQGRMLTSSAALEAGMVDGVASLDEVLSDLLLNTNGTSGMAHMSTNVIKQHLNSQTKVKLESVGIEHSEPGTGSGSEPEPRPQDPEKDAKEGWRRDTPPIELEVETRAQGIVNSYTQATVQEEGSMDREQLLSLADKLGIKNAADLKKDDELKAAVDSGVVSLVSEVGPLRDAAARASEAAEFSVQYPEQAKRMERLEEENRVIHAEKFAAGYERFTKTDGEKEVKSTIGFSTVTVNAIQDMHHKLANREANTDDLTTLLDSISSAGLVDYGEKGSSRAADTGGAGVTHGGEEREQRLAFAEKVEEIMKEDSLSYDKAVYVAAERYPEEFADYRSRVPSRQ